MEDATSWADARLANLGVARLGPMERVRDRPWSSVWRLPSEIGTLWLKACGPGGRYEVGLIALLAQVAPEWTLQPTALDLDAGLVLLPDGGPAMSEALSGDPDAVLRRWQEMVREYADLQRRMEAYTVDLLAVGVPDLRPAAVTERFRSLVETVADEDLRRRLLARVPTVEQAAANLADGVPPTVQHDDLHDANVLAGPDGLGPPAFFDWGDAMVSHPFATLLVTRRVLTMRLGKDAESSAADRLTDAYLDAWADIAPRARLRDHVDDALVVGAVGRAWSWARALQAAPEPEWDRWEQPVAHWLSELL